MKYCCIVKLSNERKVLFHHKIFELVDKFDNVFKRMGFFK